MSVILQIFLFPRNTVILFLKGYRKFISPLYGEVCRYYPSCSAFGLQQVQQRGVFLGSALTVLRIIRCNPWSKGGFDEVKPSGQRFEVSESGFVIAKPKKGH
jgi:putative membrane protein insertion efficiency factor